MLKNVALIHFFQLVSSLNARVSSLKLSEQNALSQAADARRREIDAVERAERARGEVTGVVGYKATQTEVEMEAKERFKNYMCMLNLLKI